MKLKVQNTSEKFCKIHPFLYWKIVPFLCTRRPGTDSARRQGILRIDLGRERYRYNYMNRAPEFIETEERHEKGNMNHAPEFIKNRRRHENMYIL